MEVEVIQMSRHLKAIFILILLIFVSSNTVKANDFIGAYFYYDDKLVMLKNEYIGEFTISEQAYIVFEQLFRGITPNWSGVFTYIPKDTKLLDVALNNDSLQINVSKEILNYGGTAWEENLKKQILHTAFSIPGVNRFTLFIEGAEGILTEGTRLVLTEKGNL